MAERVELVQDRMADDSWARDASGAGAAPAATPGVNRE